MLSDDELTAYALRLYERRAEGIITRVARAQIGDWVPTEHECHDNVTTWCHHYSDHRPVCGWVYFDFVKVRWPGDAPFVRFNMLSVIETEHGELVDITPSRASTQYPFIRAEESEADYERIIEALKARGVEYLNYYPGEFI